MGSLTLLHPWLLAGLVAAALPILIHLIGRRRAPQVRFAAFDFLVAVNKRLARRERLRQFLLLLFRALAVAALVFAVARPMPARPAMAGDANRRLVLVVDGSASMGYRLEGTVLLERAKSAAAEVISHLEPGDAVTLVIAGEEVRSPFQAPTVDHAAVRAAIDELDEPKGVADLGTAIDNGLAQLGEDGGGATLVVIGDLAKNSFEQIRPTSMEPPPEVRLIDVAGRDEPTALANAAIETVVVQHSDDASSERRFKVVVRNFGSAPVVGRAVELVIDERVEVRGFLDVAARGSEEKILTHTFEGPGVYRGIIRLADDSADGFGADDTAAFVTDVIPGIRVLAINGDPRTTPYEDELFFLERALEAVPRGDPPITLRIATPEEFLDTDLEGFDVVVAANLSALDDREVRRLQQFVSDGGGILFTLGDRVDFEQANSVFGDLLPHALRDLHRAADPDAGTPPVGVTGLDWDHPILSGLGLAFEQGLTSSETRSYFNLGVGAGLKARAVLRFDNGAPALVERRQGEGRSMMLTTSIDVDLTDLPLRSAFPPLLQRTVRYLARAVEVPRGGEVRAGGTVQIAAPTAARGIALVSPSGTRRVYTLGEGGRRARFDDVSEVGIHEVEVQRAEGWKPEPRLAVAVNPSLAESDFLPARAEQISEALGGDREGGAISVVVGSSDDSDPFQSRGYASYLLAALCLLFVGESLLASRG